MYRGGFQVPGLSAPELREIAAAGARDIRIAASLCDSPININDDFQDVRP